MKRATGIAVHATDEGRLLRFIAEPKFKQPHLFGIFPMPGKKPSVTVNQERPDGVHGDFFRIDLKAK